MKNEIIDYLRNHGSWFKMSISDVAWFLSTTEGEIRKWIAGLNLIAPPLTKIPADGEMKKGNLCFFYTVTPYFVFRDEMILLATALGRKSLPKGPAFKDRMQPIEEESSRFDARVKSLMRGP
ncbi:MAG: hypothetical protein M3Q07_24070, partial [Pseudobdellovibrionaceae bacterium]|nr:hypothetical protein [Pseudobdellovibrionaceae bacterium]